MGLIRRLLTHLSTRRCRDEACLAREPHDSHLTLLGRLRFTGSIR